MDRMIIQQKIIRLCLLVLFILFTIMLSLYSKAYAHPLNNGYSKLTLEMRAVKYDLFIPETSLSTYDSNRDKSVSASELEANQSRLSQDLMEHIQLDNGTHKMAFTLLSMENTDEGGIAGVLFHLFYTSDQPIERLKIQYQFLFDDADPQHINFLTLIDGEDGDQALFDTNHRMYQYDRFAPTSWLHTMMNYLRLGVEHILSGYDHLLFVLSLLIAASRFGQLIRIVTAFTAAHSITLFLAASDRISLPPVWVEAAIALSILYVALENIAVRKVQLREALTFVFGLVHGLGFASALKETDLPKDHLISSLLAFNIGVEAGQLLVITAVMPILIVLHKKGWRRPVNIYVSSGIALIALYWFLQRIGVI
jgi:hypothetical protein